MPYTNADVTAGSATGGRIKVLILAPPKAGKTVLAVKTSPGPVFVVNADPGGLTSAVGLGAKFEAEDVFDYATLSKTLNYLKGKKSTYKTIVIDTLTLLSQSLEAEGVGIVGVVPRVEGSAPRNRRPDHRPSVSRHSDGARHRNEC